MLPKKKTSGRGTKVTVVRGAAGKWVVKEFNPDTLVGVVELGSDSRKFHSTSFQSDTGFRFPRRGETVEVALASSGVLLSVHGK
jgi:hypothetical protein